MAIKTIPLSRLETDLKVVARCRDGDEALKAVRQNRPDILVLDIQMPAKDGLMVLREMRKEKLPTRVVVLTATLGEEGLTEAVRLGIRGLPGDADLLPAVPGLDGRHREIVGGRRDQEIRIERDVGLDRDERR